MDGDVRIAVVQFTAGEDKPANLERLLIHLDTAADADADLVVAPEASMLDFGPPSRPVAPQAEPLDGPFITAVSQAAAQRGVTVVVGMFEATDDPQRAYNTVVAVGPTGPIGYYRKQHLFDALGWQESAKLLAGEAAERLVFDCGELRVGVMTCYDLRFPELARALVDEGATLLALPSAWVAGEHKVAQWTTLTTARAVENVCYVAAADQAGPTYAGHSRLVDPFGVTLAAAEDGDGVVVADVAASRVAECRQKMPSLEHRRWQVNPRRR